MAYYTRSKFNFAQNNHINSTASGENTFHHYLCIGLPQIRSAKSDFIFAISMSKTGPLPPTQILHDHCLQFLLGITIVPIREIEDNKTMVMHFFLVGGGGWGGNKVHCGLCENGELPSFCFSFHSAKTTLSLRVLTSGGLMT